MTARATDSVYRLTPIWRSKTWDSRLKQNLAARLGALKVSVGKSVLALHRSLHRLEWNQLGTTFSPEDIPITRLREYTLFIVLAGLC